VRTWLSTLTVVVVITTSCKKDEVAAPKPPAPTAPSGVRTVTMAVTADGYVPDNIALKANEPVKFVVTRKTEETCATDLLIDGTDIKVALPLNQPVEIAWTPPKAGNVKFGCAMDMMISGVLVVE
jgi:plastocyanin domain-containing protein